MLLKNYHLHILLVATLILLAACSPGDNSPTPQSVRSNSTPSPEALSDCFWSAAAHAWLDTNGNGLQDEEEPPLEGIEFVLEPTVYSRTKSGADGIADIFATTPNAGTNESCEQLAARNPLQVIAVTYEGYELTTPNALPYETADSSYEFGFKPVGGQTTTLPEGSPLVAGASGLALSPDWQVARVNYLAQWYGEGWPLWEYEQLTSEAGTYTHPNGQDKTTAVAALLASINNLTPATEVRWTNLWTDDYPVWYTELVGQNGQRLLLHAQSTGFRGNAPWYVLIDGQLYRQTSGDIGYAMADIVSDEARDYFSLDQQDFDETLLESGSWPTIYREEKPVTGLLPIVRTLRLQTSPDTLSGTFYLDEDNLEYDISSQPITGVEAVALLSSDGQSQACSIESIPNPPDVPGYIQWNFQCDNPGETAEPLTLQVTFTTSTEMPLVVDGTLNLYTK